MRNLIVALSTVVCLFMLTGQVFAQKIELTWSPNPEPDIKEYVIYRAVSSPDAEESEIATVPATETVYYDGNITVGEVYYYRIAAVDSADNMSELSEQITVFTDTPTDARNSPTALPEEFELLQNYPNPFNPETTIRYSVPQATHVRLDIINTRGQMIRSLVNENKQPGTYNVIWDARTDLGVPAASAVYIYRISTTEFSKGMKLILLK